jgi:EAL domain-containing protein (putative c-di-GMP-specific phosphodiesterase class I)
MMPAIKRTLAATGCEPSWLELEITETSMVRDLEGVRRTLTNLRELGIRVAIDDFGTGFSSLSHLRQFPIDVLKIDKSFVADIEAGPTGKPKAGSSGTAIVAAVLGLARGLGLEVVAEGIEKKSQLAFLNREGCSSGQGYLLCAPLPAPELEKWLRARKRKSRTTR